MGHRTRNTNYKYFIHFLFYLGHRLVTEAMKPSKLLSWQLESFFIHFVCPSVRKILFYIHGTKKVVIEHRDHLLIVKLVPLHFVLRYLFADENWHHLHQTAQYRWNSTLIGSTTPCWCFSTSSFFIFLRSAWLWCTGNKSKANNRTLNVYILAWGPFKDFILQQTNRALSSAILRAQIDLDVAAWIQPNRSQLGVWIAG